MEESKDKVNIVVNVNSGLGNQMLGYCALLSLKKANPDANCYLETIIYDIPECGKVTNQWNGFELGKIFGINTPNVKDLFSNDEWEKIITEIRDGRFWEKHYNYPVYISNALNHAGLKLVNVKGDFEAPNSTAYRKPSLDKRIRNFVLNKTTFGAKVKVLYHYIFRGHLNDKRNAQDKLFLKTSNSIYAGLWLDFKFLGNNIDSIHDDIIKSFTFPEFIDDKNKKMKEVLESRNSVFIHARRGDMLSTNGYLYKYGYFKRAVKLIKKKIEDPLFVFFTNSGSIEWCKDHSSDIFGLDKKDNVIFVDWNTGEQSFRDMQLMTHCKHGIITNSTFGWWGAYLIQNPDKITISPSPEINTTYHC